MHTHTSIIYTTYPLRVRGGLEPIPVDTSQEVGYSLDKLPAYVWTNIQTQTTIHTHIHTYDKLKTQFNQTVDCERKQC